MPMRPTRRSVTLLALLGLLAGCSSPPPKPTYPDLRFTDRPPIQIDVAAIDVRVDYQPPYRAPNVEHLFPVPPVRAAENWAHDRLKPVGQSGRAHFTIRNASVVEVELKRTEGIKGAFTTQPAERYDMTLEAQLQIVDDHGFALRTATVRAQRSQSVLEGITPNDRDQAWYDMTKALMADFDRQMETEIRNNFGYYVK